MEVISCKKWSQNEKKAKGKSNVKEVWTRWTCTAWKQPAMGLPSTTISVTMKCQPAISCKLSSADMWSSICRLHYYCFLLDLEVAGHSRLCADCYWSAAPSTSKTRFDKWGKPAAMFVASGQTLVHVHFSKRLSFQSTHKKWNLKCWLLFRNPQIFAGMEIQTSSDYCSGDI